MRIIPIVWCLRHPITRYAAPQGLTKNTFLVSQVPHKIRGFLAQHLAWISSPVDFWLVDIVPDTGYHNHGCVCSFGLFVLMLYVAVAKFLWTHTFHLIS